LTAATQKTAPALTDTDGKVIALPRDFQNGTMHVIFLGTNAADEAAAWTIWAYKDIASPAEYVANGTATLGLTQTGNTNEFYADTIAITAQSWLKTVYVVDGAPAAIIADAGISKLCLDTCEYQYWKLIGTNTTTATFGAEYGLVY
jgi:hypothetical protein